MDNASFYLVIVLFSTASNRSEKLNKLETQYVQG